MILQLSQVFLFCPTPPSTPIPSSHPPLSLCPRVMYINSLVTPFPMLFLTSPYFVPTNLCLLIPAIFPPFSIFCLPTDKPLNDLHIHDSVPVLLVCLICYLDPIIDSCEFIAILMFIILIIFFFLYNSL